MSELRRVPHDLPARNQRGPLRADVLLPSLWIVQGACASTGYFQVTARILALSLLWPSLAFGATTIYDRPTPDGKRTVQVCDLPVEEPQ